jgi:outer membrane receptor protein involved in Fe transport
LRGPQGTLFGSGSLAGAIRYVTNKPIMNQYSGAAEATLAGTETGASSYNGTLTVNVPLITDKLAVRASGYDFHDGGWIDDLSDGRKDINLSTSYGGRVTLRAQPVERLTADLTVMYQRAEDYAQGDSLYAAPSNTGQSGQVTYGRSEPHVIGENTIIGFDLKYNLDNASLFSQTVYHDRNVREVGSDNYFVPLVTAIATGFSNIVQGPDNIQVPEESKNFTQEFRASSNGSGPFKWTVGAFYLHADLNTGQENRSPLVTPYVGGDAIVDVSAPGHQSEVAGFGEATYTLANKLDLTAGLRVSQTDIRYHVVTGGFIPVGTTAASAYVTENFHENDTPVNPHFSVTYRMTPDFSIYAAAARGFRVGGINETSGVGGRASPPSYGPDSLWNYEGGAKGRLFDGRLTYSADIYYIDWTNIQVSLQNNLGNYTGNAGGATLYGFEGQFDAKPVDWLQLGASVSISHNTLNTDTPGLVTAVGVITAHKGDLLPASPESQFSAYAEYDFTLLAHTGYLRINGNYIGSEYLGFAKTGSEFGDYSELDLRAGMHFDRYELIVFANNLLNSQGKQSAAEAVSVGPVVLGDQSAYRIRPLTVGVTVRAKF